MARSTTPQDIAFARAVFETGDKVAAFKQAWPAEADRPDVARIAGMRARRNCFAEEFKRLEDEAKARAGVDATGPAKATAADVETIVVQSDDVKTERILDWLYGSLAVDPTALLDGDGSILPPDKWPESIKPYIDSVDFNVNNGRQVVKLVDRTKLIDQASKILGAYARHNEQQNPIAKLLSGLSRGDLLAIEAAATAHVAKLEAESGE